MSVLFSFSEYHSRYCSSDTFDIASERYSKYVKFKKYLPLIKHLFSLYCAPTYKWIEQLPGGLTYTHNIYDNKEYNLKYQQQLKLLNKKGAREFVLNERDLFAHLIGEKSIGIYPSFLDNSFLVFDVDSLDFSIVRSICATLKHYISKDNILIHFSGNKGYHISLFFDEKLERKYIQDFFDFIVNETRSKFYDSTEINTKNDVLKVVECRGGKSNQGLMLPLGFNFRNKSGSGKKYFVDEYGDIIKDRAFIFSIQKVEKSNIIDILEINDVNITDKESIIIEERKNDRKDITVPVKYLNEQYIENLIECGIRESGTRHYSMFSLSLFLKGKGLDKSAAVKFISKWHNDKNDKKYYDSDDNYIQKEIDYITKSVFKNSKYKRKFTDYFSFSKAEFDEIFTVENKKLREIYFMFFVFYKKMAHNGKIQFSYSLMEKYGATQNRGRMRNYILELQKLGKIEIIRKKCLKPANLRKNDWEMWTNMYRLPQFEIVKLKNENKIMYKLNLEQNEINKEFCNMIAKQVFSNNELKNYYNKNQRTDLKKLDCKKCIVEEIIEKDEEFTKVEIENINNIENENLRKAYFVLAKNTANLSLSKNKIIDMKILDAYSINKRLIDELINLALIEIVEQEDEYIIYKLLQKRKANKKISLLKKIIKNE